MVDPCFRRAAGGVSSLGLHPVWCAKCRRRLLGDRVTVRLSELLEEIAVEKDWEVVTREVISDYVHILVRVRPTDSPAEVARRFKGRTGGAGRAEVGYVSEQTVRRYVEQRWDAA